MCPRPSCFRGDPVKPRGQRLTRPPDGGRADPWGPRSRPNGYTAGVSRVATYRADDPAELVAASLACPWCLAARVDYALDAEDPFDASADCRCRACGHGWRLFLAPEQALRLALAPAR